MENKKNIQPVILLAATTWWPLSSKLAVSLLDHGCTLEAVCPPGHPLRYVRGVSRFHDYRRLNSLLALRKSIAVARPALVVPCDDGVVEQLHELYRQWPELQPLITRSLGTATYFDVVSSREQLQQVAQELNIRVPRNKRVTTENELRDWFGRMGTTAVLKQDGTWGGNGVRVVHSLPEAKVELSRMLRPLPRWTPWKRMFVNRDPLALWNNTRKSVPEVTLQEYISGRPANVMIACWKGQVLGAVTVEVLWSQGTMGAAMVVRLIDNREIVHAACALAGKMQLSGFYGLDFVIEEDSGAAYLIEMNPRCTQLGHLPIAGVGDLAGLLCAKLGAAAAETAAREPMGLRSLRGLSIGETVAFYPKALLWNANISYVSEGYMDAPREQPVLMEELLKQEWPDRQWQARLYHWLRPPKREQPATFEASTPAWCYKMSCQPVAGLDEIAGSKSERSAAGT